MYYIYYIFPSSCVNFSVCVRPSVFALRSVSLFSYLYSFTLPLGTVTN
jgi:hypothetical protein